MKTCPHCGWFVPDPRAGNAREGVRLSPQQARLFDIVKRSGTVGINRHHIIEIMYAQADEYPAPNIVAVMVRNINHKFLRAHKPIRLVATMGIGATYRVMQL